MVSVVFFRFVPGCRMSVGCKVWGRRVCMSHQLRWLNRYPHVWACLCFQHGDLSQWVWTATRLLQPASWCPATDRHILRGLSREECCSCKYVACILLSRCSRCSSSAIYCIWLTFFIKDPYWKERVDLLPDRIKVFKHSSSQLAWQERCTKEDLALQEFLSMHLRQCTRDREGKIGALSEVLSPRHTGFKWTINHNGPFRYLSFSTLWEGKEHPM